MPFYIKSDEVTALAEEAQRVLGTNGKTEAVALALRAAIASAKRNTPLLQRIESMRQLAEAIGPVRH